MITEKSKNAVKYANPNAEISPLKNPGGKNKRPELEATAESLTRMSLTLLKDKHKSNIFQKRDQVLSDTNYVLEGLGSGNPQLLSQLWGVLGRPQRIDILLVCVDRSLELKDARRQTLCSIPTGPPICGTSRWPRPQILETHRRSPLLLAFSSTDNRYRSSETNNL